MSPGDAKQSRIERRRHQDGDGHGRHKDAVEVQSVEDALVAAFVQCRSVPHEHGDADGDVKGPQKRQQVFRPLRWQEPLVPAYISICKYMSHISDYITTKHSFNCVHHSNIVCNK